MNNQLETFALFAKPLPPLRLNYLPPALAGG